MVKHNQTIGGIIALWICTSHFFRSEGLHPSDHSFFLKQHLGESIAACVKIGCGIWQIWQTIKFWVRPRSFRVPNPSAGSAATHDEEGLIDHGGGHDIRLWGIKTSIAVLWTQMNPGIIGIGHWIFGCRMFHANITNKMVDVSGFSEISHEILVG